MDRSFYVLYSNRSFVNVEFGSPASLERPLFCRPIWTAKILANFLAAPVRAMTLLVGIPCRLACHLLRFFPESERLATLAMRCALVLLDADSGTIAFVFFFLGAWPRLWQIRERK